MGELKDAFIAVTFVRIQPLFVPLVQAAVLACIIVVLLRLSLSPWLLLSFLFVLAVWTVIFRWKSTRMFHKLLLMVLVSRY